MAFIRVEPVQVHVRTDWFSGRPREITWGTERLPVTHLAAIREEEAGGVGHLHQPVTGHLQHADLLGRPGRRAPRTVRVILPLQPDTSEAAAALPTPTSSPLQSGRR